jgi:hypothetical protein
MLKRRLSPDPMPGANLRSTTVTFGNVAVFVEQLRYVVALSAVAGVAYLVSTLMHVWKDVRPKMSVCAKILAKIAIETVKNNKSFMVILL